jgi:hypothetical protein
MEPTSNTLLVWYEEIGVEWHERIDLLTTVEREGHLSGKPTIRPNG